jgi:hypothetical protein
MKSRNIFCVIESIQLICKYKLVQLKFKLWTFCTCHVYIYIYSITTTQILVYVHCTVYHEGKEYLKKCSKHL